MWLGLECGLEGGQKQMEWEDALQAELTGPANGQHLGEK